MIQGEAIRIQTAQSPPAAPQAINLDARDLRDQIKQAVRAQIAPATQGAGGGAGAGAATGAPQAPPAPAGPRIITLHGRNGTETISIPPFDASDVIPPQAVEISIAFFIMVAVIIIGLPLARAVSRRMDRKPTGGQIPGELSAQLAQLNQSVDAIALEVERISEGQRFTARLLSEQREAARPTLPSGASR